MPVQPAADDELDWSEQQIPDFLNLLPMACLNSFPRLKSTISVDESVSRMVGERSYNSNKLMALFPLRSLDVDTPNSLTHQPTYGTYKSILATAKAYHLLQDLY